MTGKKKKIEKHVNKALVYTMIILLGLVAFFIGAYSSLSEAGFFSDETPAPENNVSKVHDKVKKNPGPSDLSVNSGAKGINKKENKRKSTTSYNKRSSTSGRQKRDESRRTLDAKPSKKRLSSRNTRAYVAIVIDDFGNSLKNVDEFCNADIPLTLAVLPKTPYSGKISWKARQAGKEVILHLPLENHAGINPGPGTLTTKMSKEEVRKAFEENLKSVPGVVGFNNHEGSKATENRKIMETIMKQAKGKGLFFIDSYTSSKTVGLETARKEGVSGTRRNIFLDNENSIDYICRQLEKLADTAEAKGKAVGIGHCRANTIKAIKKMAPKLKNRGIRFVFASEIIDR